MLIILVTGVNNTSKFSQGNNCTLNVSQGNNCSFNVSQCNNCQFYPTEAILQRVLQEYISVISG